MEGSWDIFGGGLAVQLDTTAQMFMKNGNPEYSRSWEEETEPTDEFGFSVHGNSALTSNKRTAECKTLDVEDEIRQSKKLRETSVNPEELIAVPPFLGECQNTARVIQNLWKESTSIQNLTEEQKQKMADRRAKLVEREKRFQDHQEHKKKKKKERGVLRKIRKNEREKQRREMEKEYYRELATLCDLAPNTEREKIIETALKTLLASESPVLAAK
uniref:BHLH domain-containing protein n=1 Tax=Mucochytrium quahogii TaxID=96639 RepID=A0A7S2S0J1_9STRA|mmetsp:Transcript_7453/g.11985  ORF Transcript_7453/g.11985 Transcript_7453/m.11985 type:complete len:216 (+) Transcript_7453:355-1002(+)|eukprot:CAMPEP_0203799002 /NCGR_PEP_ID=MMETSP0100_2-20121128/9657_1 /ASSEMBLY_ACC=CAM_ASM_000210 /TAXON_ID=96639 /ORGANISM=" , Strain NY0313808BC1" /LENGTH=215 /DNA_ID=CAMNT_0050704801 /DNA_START=323 /DNA_END=970 /DNA_ORIENTATION=-